MKKHVLRWYNAFREEWGLDSIGLEPEETDDLVLEDFRFRQGKPEDLALVEELHCLCLEDYRKYAEQNGLKSTLEPLFESPSQDLAFPGDLSLVAETGHGDFAAYISTVRRASSLYINILEVKTEYRGLGLGEALLSRLISLVDPRSTSTVLVDLPCMSEGFSRVLLRESFKPYVHRYSLRLQNK
jgi:GNAT superfamily N-acetyltransferase